MFERLRWLIVVFNISMNSFIYYSVLKLQAGSDKGFFQVFSWLNKHNITVHPRTAFHFWQLASYNNLNPPTVQLITFFN